LRRGHDAVLARFWKTQPHILSCRAVASADPSWHSPDVKSVLYFVIMRGLSLSPKYHQGGELMNATTAIRLASPEASPPSPPEVSAGGRLEDRRLPAHRAMLQGQRTSIQAELSHLCDLVRVEN